LQSVRPTPKSDAGSEFRIYAASPRPALPEPPEGGTPSAARRTDSSCGGLTDLTNRKCDVFVGGRDPGGSAIVCGFEAVEMAICQRTESSGIRTLSHYAL